MMEEIITLMIHEAKTTDEPDLCYGLKSVLTTLNMLIEQLIQDLSAVKKMEISDDAREQMINLLIQAHKT